MGKKIQYIGRYVMDGVVLGKGNFARVELATHGVTQTKVAIKVMDTKKIKEDYVRMNLHREAKLMARLRHPNVIRLYETLKATTLYCLVLEYAAGGELLAYIKSQKDLRLGESAARPFIRQIISALQYLHERGIVHRDLKMENIMLDDTKKNVKIIDFGLSNVYKETEPLKTHCGSPEYAAPELFLSGNTYGFEIDVWSLGIVMYAMIIGRLPFRTPIKDDYHRKQLLEMIQKGLSSFHDREMQHLTTDCRNLLRQLIEPNPKLRAPLSEIMHHPWVTKNGKLPFTPFVPLPKDKAMRTQLLLDLGVMMDLPKKTVMETVNENRADELSAMFNMMLDEKKKVLGYFDMDHTCRKSHLRDGRSRSRERGAMVGKGKGLGQKKVPNKSSKNKTSSSATSTPDTTSQTKTKGDKAPGTSTSTEKPCPRVSGERSGSSEREVQVGDKARILLDADVMPDKPSAKLNPAMLSTPSANSTPKKSSLAPQSAAAAAAEAARAAMEEKPATTEASTTAAPPSTTTTVTQATANGPTRIPQRRGPLNMTLDLSKPPPHSPTTKIPLACTTKDGTVKIKTQPVRPSTLLCGSGSSLRNILGKSEDLEDNLDKVVAGASKQDVAKQQKVVAPKATPEDLTLTTFSSSSSEANLDTMQREMLNVSQEKLIAGQPSKAESKDNAPALNHPLSQKPVIPVMAGLKKLISDPKGSRNFLTFKLTLTDSQRFESSGSQVSAASSGSQATQQGSGLIGTVTRKSLELNVNSNTCLLPKSSSERSPEVVPVTAPPVPSSPPLGATGGREPEGTVGPSKPSTSSLSPLRLPGTSSKECQACGLSPSSPTYMERHKKFCHTGAHALDLFVSPDENPSPTGPLFRPVMASTSSSPPHRQRELNSPIFKFPKVGVGTPHQPMQASPAGRVDHYSSDDEDDDEEDFCHNKPLIPQRKLLPQPRMAVSTTAAGKRTPTSKTERRKPREKYKRYSGNGVFTQVPDTSMRLDPVGAASSDSLSGASNSSRQGDGSTEKLSTGSKAKVHPMDKGKESSSQCQMEALLSDTQILADAVVPSSTSEIVTSEKASSKSLIPRPATRFGKLQLLSLLGSSTDKTTNSHEETATQTSQKSGKKTQRSSTEEKPSRASTWRQGLTHLLRRGRSSGRSTTNNNVSLLRNKQSNGLTGNSLASKSNPGKAVVVTNREAFIDSKWSASESPTHKTCNSTVSGVGCPGMGSSPSSPVQTQQLIEVTSRGSSPRSPRPGRRHHRRRAKHRKVGWAGCKDCAKSELSSDEGTEMTYHVERHSSSVKASLMPQSNDSRQMASSQPPTNQGTTKV